MVNCLTRISEGSSANLVYAGSSDGSVRCINTRGLKECFEDFLAGNREALAKARAEEEGLSKEKIKRLERRMKRALKDKEGKLREEAIAEAKAAKAAELEAAKAAKAAEGGEEGEEEKPAEEEEPPAEEGEEEKVKLTGTLPEEHPKFQALEEERKAQQDAFDASKANIEAKLDARVRLLREFYLESQGYKKEGAGLKEQQYYTEVIHPSPDSVLCLCARDEAVPGQEGVTQPVLFRGEAGGVVRELAKVTARTL
eukprot:Hpha_TRINITY_DN16695_c7_g5::TRINITY_DN16695_c7_g5_i1::g.182557::m.182557